MARVLIRRRAISRENVRAARLGAAISVSSPTRCRRRRLINSSVRAIEFWIRSRKTAIARAGEKPTAYVINPHPTAA
jgi:hypothetical protein